MQAIHTLRRGWDLSISNSMTTGTWSTSRISRSNPSLNDDKIVLKNILGWIENIISHLSENWYLLSNPRRSWVISRYFNLSAWILQYPCNMIYHFNCLYQLSHGYLWQSFIFKSSRLHKWDRACNNIFMKTILMEIQSKEPRRMNFYANSKQYYRTFTRNRWIEQNKFSFVNVVSRLSFIWIYFVGR